MADFDINISSCRNAADAMRSVSGTLSEIAQMTYEITDDLPPDDDSFRELYVKLKSGSEDIWREADLTGSMADSLLNIAGEYSATDMSLC